MSNPRIAIILGSTRPGRNGRAVAEWVEAAASLRDDAVFELIDLKDHPLPLLDEAVPAAAGKYANDHTKAWAAVVDRFDGYIFVTPEYNHSTSGVLKNAIDYVYGEWNNKAAAFVSYGTAGGVRAVEHLRLIAAELQLATVRQQVTFSLVSDFKDYHLFTPGGGHTARAEVMFDQLIAWTTAMRGVREALKEAAEERPAD